MQHGIGVRTALRATRWAVLLALVAVALPAPASALVHLDASVEVAGTPLGLGATADDAAVVLEWEGERLATDLLPEVGDPLRAASLPEPFAPAGGPMPGLGALARPEVQALGATGAAAGLAALALGLRPMMLAPLFSRLQRGELLNHPVRRDLLRIISTDPGVNISELHGRMDLGWGSLLYHLQRLEAQEFIISRRWGRSRRYFLNQRGLEARAHGIRALKAPNALALASIVAAQPGRTQAELATQMSLCKSVVSKYAKRLEDAALVQRQVGRNCLRLFPTDALRELLHTVPHSGAGAGPLAPPEPTAPSPGGGVQVEAYA